MRKRIASRCAATASYHVVRRSLGQLGYSLASRRAIARRGLPFAREELPHESPNRVRYAATRGSVITAPRVVWPRRYGRPERDRRPAGSGSGENRESIPATMPHERPLGYPPRFVASALRVPIPSP